MEASNSGNRDNFVTGGNAPGGKGILGAGSGGDSVKQNGQGRPGGEPTNLVNTTVNGGGGYSNTVHGSLKLLVVVDPMQVKQRLVPIIVMKWPVKLTVTGNLPPSSVDPVVVVPVVGGMAVNSVSVEPVPVVVAVVRLNLWLMEMDRS